MTHIYDALLRIEKLYDCKTATDTANLLGMPKMTFFDNRRKALEDYKKIEQLKNEQNPVKKAILEKTINSNGKKQYINSLYLSFIELAARDNLNLNWVFYNQLPIYNNEEKIAKVVQNYYLSEHLNDDSVAIPYFTDIKASAGNGYINSEDKTSDFIVLPKSMISGKKLNAINTGLPKNNTSGVKGVSWNKACGKWSAQIKVDGKKKHLGTFSNLEDATKTRRQAERLYGFII